MKKIIVKQELEKEVSTEVLADAILAISQGVKKLRGGKLNDNALFLLIQHAAPNVKRLPISMKTIKAVFEGIDSLAGTYLCKVPPK